MTCRSRPFTPVVSCRSGRGVAGVVRLDGIGGLGESQMRLVPCVSSGVAASGGALPGLAKLGQGVMVII